MAVREPTCPSCGKLYPYGDPRAVVDPPRVCFECEGAGLGIPPVRADLTIPDDAVCQEASVLSRDRYIPCGAPAVAIVDNGDRRPYYMCGPCTTHNVRNRRARVVAVKAGEEKWG